MNTMIFKIALIPQNHINLHTHSDSVYPIRKNIYHSLIYKTQSHLLIVEESSQVDSWTNFFVCWLY